MAIAYVGAVRNTFSGTQGWAGFGEPAGSQDGDILLLFVATDTNHDTTGTPPTGWTKIAEIDTGTDSSMSVFWKRRSGAENESWSTIFAATNESGVVVMLGYRGCVASGDPQDVAATTETGSGTAWDSPSITPVTNECMVVAAFGTDPGTDPFTFTWDAGITERIDSDTTPSGQNALFGYIAVGDKVVNPAAATSLGGDASGADTPAEISIALKPEPGGAPAGSDNALLLVGAGR